MSAAQLRLSQPEAGVLRVQVSGSWALATGLPSTSEVEHAIDGGQALSRLCFDAADLETWDSSLVNAIYKLVRHSKRAGVPLDLSESHQWAEPLKDSVSRVIAVNLSNKLKSNRVYIIPRRPKISLDFQVSIDIARFDGRLGEAATLDARWTLYGKDTREPLLSKVTIVYEKTRGSSYDALVGASSRTLEVLSMEIAEAINARR